MASEVRRYEYETNGGLIRMGIASMKEIQSWITDRSSAVAELVKQSEIKYEHLVYAAKYYCPDIAQLSDRNGTVEKVCFYCQPYTDAEYEQVAAMKDCIVYAVHRRRACGTQEEVRI